MTGLLLPFLSRKITGVFREKSGWRIVFNHSGYLTEAVGFQTVRFKPEQVRLLHSKISYGSILKSRGVRTKYKIVLRNVNGICCFKFVLINLIFYLQRRVKLLQKNDFGFVFLVFFLLFLQSLPVYKLKLIV